jgi:hypothetical protein
MHVSEDDRGIDVVVAVPFQSRTGFLVDPLTRRSAGAHYGAYVFEAIAELTELIGRPLDRWDEYNPIFSDGQILRRPVHRSLSAVALATVLERAGLRWKILDPGTEELAWFRCELIRLAPLDPPLFAICSTFVRNGAWLKMLIAMARRLLPRAKIAVGGYYYATDTEDFLRLDADILFVGEGELRFPELVRAVRENRSLAGIRGLYLRQHAGGLEFTGSVAQLDLAKHSRPDWRLVSRIDPPVSLENDFFEAAVETQRGCVFKCEFCTYRTLSAPSLMDPESAVERIMDTRVLRQGGIALSDATATFPHQRWKDICAKLVARGGAPHPAWAYARVSDIDEETARLMHLANVRLLLIGQESGDQRILDRMRKGTRVSQVAPAIRALAHHELTVCMTMICGFPGETEESAENTRRVLMTLNDECRDRPVVLLYKINPFHMDDFAAIARDEAFRDAHRDPRFRFASREFDIERSGMEAIRSIIAISKIPHAPASGWATGEEYLSIDLLTRPNRFEIFRWMKQIDRAIGIFLEHRLYGVRPSRNELGDLRERILRPLPSRGRIAEARTRARALVERRAISVLRGEWKREVPGKVGRLTGAIVGAKALHDSGSMRDAAASFLAGTYAPRAAPPDETKVTEHATALISDATEKARTAKLPVIHSPGTPSIGP